MTKQTAVEWLIEQIKEYDFSPRDNTFLIEIPSWILKENIKQAKEMEKEQIKDAWLSAWKDSMINPLEDKYYEIEAEQYYNETYGGNNE